MVVVVVNRARSDVDMDVVKKKRRRGSLLTAATATAALGSKFRRKFPLRFCLWEARTRSRGDRRPSTSFVSCESESESESTRVLSTSAALEGRVEP